MTGRASEKTIVWSTDDGKDWREELDIKLSRSYSRVHWRNERAYCVSDESSSCGEKFEFFRLESADVDSAPKTVYKLSHNSHTLTGPRESQLVLAEDRAVCLLSFETYNFDRVRRWLVPSGKYCHGENRCFEGSLYRVDVDAKQPEIRASQPVGSKGQTHHRYGVHRRRRSP